MKKSLFTIAFILLSAISAHAYDFSAVCSTGQTLYYTINGDYVSVSRDYSNSPTGNLVIPETVTFNGITYAVNSISSRAFQGCTELTAVTIPNSIISIGDHAFSGCTGINSIIIPNSVSTIEAWAFSSCMYLTSITIPSSVSTIGNGAFSSCFRIASVNFNAINCTTMGTCDSPVFRNCSSLTVLNIGDSVEHLPECAFKGCSQLTNVTIGRSLTSCSGQPFAECNSITTVNFNATHYPPFDTYYSTGAIFMGLTSITTLNIGDNVQVIPGNCFSGCTGITSVVFPSTIDSIGGYAFDGCNNLTGVLTIPPSVSFIGRHSFRGCDGLAGVNFYATNCNLDITRSNESIITCSSPLSVNIGNNVQRIPAYLFDGCSSLTGNLTLPNSVTSIGECAFRGCSGLSGMLTIPNSVVSIGGHAFDGCSGLSSLTLSNSINSISDFSFKGCNGLTGMLEIPNSVVSIGGYAFEGCGGLSSLTLSNSINSISDFSFKGCNGLEGILNIPNSVTSIGNSAFYGCSSLSSLVLGNNVSTIGDNAFDGCSVLLDIHSKNPVPPTLGNNVFNSVAPAIPVYIPCGRMALYSYNWPYFSNFMESPASSVTAVSADDLMGTAIVTTAPTCTNPVAVVEAYPNSGYQFDHWSDGATDNPYSFNVSEDMNITAYFSSIGSQPTTYYTITAVSSNPSMGSVTGGGTYAEGSTVTLTATPINGYSFLRWREDNNTDNPRTITVTGDRTYTAIFQYTGGSEPQQYLVTVNSIDETMGTVTGGGLFDEGTVTTIMATAKPGYLFVQWQDGNTQRIRTITVTGDATYTAYFDYSNGIDDVGAADDVKIYTRGNTIVIDFSGQHAADIRQSVVVYDVMGRVIKQAAGGGQRAMVEIPVSGTGVYMVKVGDMKPQKVVVRR